MTDVRDAVLDRLLDPTRVLFGQSHTLVSGDSFTVNLDATSYLFTSPRAGVVTGVKFYHSGEVELIYKDEQ